jgi:hypothetical protein
LCAGGFRVEELSRWRESVGIGTKQIVNT